MKTFEALIQYRTPAGSLDNDLLTISANSNADAKKTAKRVADERANEHGGHVCNVYRKDEA